MLACICAVKELSIEELNTNHSKDELKENVDNENVENILEGDNHTVKNSLQLWNSVDCLQRSKYPEKFNRF